MEAAERYGLRAPEFLVFDDMFRVNLFRDFSLMANQEDIGEASEEHWRRFERYAAEHFKAFVKGTTAFCGKAGRGDRHQQQKRGIQHKKIEGRWDLGPPWRTERRVLGNYRNLNDMQEISQRIFPT